MVAKSASERFSQSTLLRMAPKSMVDDGPGFGVGAMAMLGEVFGRPGMMAE